MLYIIPSKILILLLSIIITSLVTNIAFYSLNIGSNKSMD